MQNETQDTTPAYEAPKVTDHGTLQDLTAAQNTGLYIDGTYPIHTPIAGHLS